MKTTRHLIALICFIVLIIPFSAHATDDTDVYDISTNVNPNVLIIFDNSISMSNGTPYDDATTYPGSYNTTDIYIRGTCSWWWFGMCMAWNWSIYGTPGDFVDTNLDGIHDDYNTLKLRKGNRLNYDNLSVTDPAGIKPRKLDVAKLVTCDIIEDHYESVRLGVMVLHGDVGWGTLPAYHQDNTVLDPTNGGSPLQQWDDDGGATDRSELKGYINNNISASGATPLAVRLINAAQYFKHADNATFGNFGTAGGFADPITPETWCRKNFVIIVTDGMPTYEGDTASANDDIEGEFDYIESFLGARTDGDYSHGTYNYDYDPTASPADTDTDPNCAYFNGNPDNAPYGGSHYLDDVAKYLYDTDLRPEPTIPGTQNITTFVIGFAVDDPFLERAATNGNGAYYTADTYAELEEALRQVMAVIVDRSQTFTAPVVPVQRTTSGDKMYISLFTPRSGENFWPGYLVKLGIGSNGELMGFASDYNTGAEVQVTDSYGTLDEDLLRSDRAPYPYWDAHQVLKGTNETSRQIYTYLNVSKDLNHSSNGFTMTNTSNLTDQKLGYPSDSTALIKYIRGLDSYDEDGDTDVNEIRDEILGDILHSRPLIIDYDPLNTTNPQRVIYVGTNDGMLHAFDDTDGSEKWAFIPPDLLPKLKDIVEGTGHQYYVDSSPQAYILDGNHDGDLLDVGDQVIIVFGERRGGNCYCALDVSDPNDPQFLWRIDNSTYLEDNFAIPPADLVLPELGQTWSEPVIGKVKKGGTTKVVAIIGGGYWPDEQSKGNVLYLIDVTNGSLVEDFTVSDHANLTYSIPSTVLAVDTTFDGYIKRVYVGDMVGQMWRFGRQRANATDTNLEDGDVDYWTPRRLFQSNSGTKIFYPPDLVLEPGYAYLYFGTGDRTDPMDIPSPDPDINRFYAVKDKNEPDDTFTTVTEADTDFFDVTDDELQDPTKTEAYKTALREQILAGDGWYIVLENDGEKVLAPPVVVYGMVLFTTFTPVDTVANPCSYGGDARLYVVNYLTAVSVIDWDSDSDLDISDRSLHIGQGIPTEVVITITDAGHVRGYVGAGGGIIHWDFTDNALGFNINSWREIF